MNETFKLTELPREERAQIHDMVKEGDRAEIIGNIVFIREPYGLVVKRCGLLGVNAWVLWGYQSVETVLATVFVWLVPDG